MPESTTIGQRFTQLIQQLGLSKNAFALSLDKTATVIQHLVDERNKPGYDLICKVFEVYPNVSKDWLLLGNGPMMLPAITEAALIPPPAVAVPAAAKPVAAPVTPNFPAALFTVSTARPAASAAPAPAEAEPPAVLPAASPQIAAETAATSLPLFEAAQPTTQSAPESTPVPSLATAAPLASLTTPDAAALTAALHAQYLQHQLALAEQRNQHLLAQQQLMQQMLDLLRRPV